MKEFVPYFFFLFLVTLNSQSFGANAQWVSLSLTTEAQYDAGIAGGEGFQKVISIVYAPSNPYIVYFSTDTAQIWKSIDGGHNWFSSANGFAANGARSLFVSPKDPDFILAAGFLGREKERVAAHLKPYQGIFMSIDGAKSWQFVYKTEFYKQDSTGSLFAIDSRTVNDKNLTIYAGSYNEGLLVSKNNGKQWRSTGFKFGHIIDIEEAPENPGALLIATSQGLYQFKDGNVIKIGNGLSQPPLSIAVSPTVPKRVYAATGTSGVFISNDMGKTFSNISNGLPSVGGYFSDLAVSPVNANIVYLGTHRGYRKGPFYNKHPNFKWKKSSSINAKNMMKSGGFYFSSPFAPNPKKPLVALSASNGKARILRTEDGGVTWFYSGSGYTGARVQDIAFTDNKEIILSLTDHGLWISSNNQQVFHSMDITASKARSSGALVLSGETIIASIGGWKEKKLAISHDNGNKWKIFNDVKGELSFIALHPQNSAIIYSGSYRSDDHGKTWNKLAYEIGAMSVKNGDVIYALGKNKSQIYKSINHGISWNEIPSFPGNIRIYKLILDPDDDKRLYIASSNGVYIYDGKSWLNRGDEHGLQKDIHGLNHIKSIAIDSSNPNILYAGKWAPGKGLSNGIFQSQDRGISWKPFNYNLGSNYNVWSILVNPYDGVVYAGTTHGLKKINVKGLVHE